MSAEGAGSLEGFTALLALEYLFRGVHSSVLREADFVAEGFVAQLAREWSFTVVRSPRMHLYMRIDIFKHPKIYSKINRRLLQTYKSGNENKYSNIKIHIAS